MPFSIASFDEIFINYVDCICIITCARALLSNIKIFIVCSAFSEGYHRSNFLKCFLIDD